jgi:TP901 family phage tail tape measure protein
MADTIISVGGETSQLERDIQKTLSKDFKLTGLDTKSFSQPLGKIKGQLGEFEKSLEASNARVVAFGASAGSIYLLTDAFKSMVKSTIDVEKTLADINTVINASEKDIKSFGNTIFDVANKTSQSFETAAEAALEFSRQGLGLEQTAKRTADALTLARLSGLSAASSVEALTAAVNSFSDAGLTTTQVVNKLAAVDAKYAVSSADLAEAIKRVGSSASEAGVSIDQLVALVTSAQQTTARGGAVIGNSFKTIFTRLQRPKVLEDLQELGIQTTNAAGETLPLIQIITQLARTFDTLGSAQKSQVGELVGGVYQINILKAVLGDLSKGYSTYSGALKASSGATNEAEKRIGKLGETLDSQINRVTNNLKRAGSVVGELTIAPALEKVLTNVNAVLETFALGKEPETLGEKAATGFLKGLGSFISGPGLLIAAAGAFKIFQRLAVFVGDAGKTILGLGQAAQQQAQIQAQILQLLQKNPQLYAQIESGAISVQSAAQGYLNIVNATNAALERQKAIAAQMTGTVIGGGMPIPPSSGGRGKGRGRAAGYMPSISDQKKMEENDARALGAPSGVRAHFGKGTIGGKKFLMNSHEIEIPNYGTNGDSAVIPKYAAGTPIKNLLNASGGGNLSDVYDINRPSDKYVNIQQEIPRFDLPRTNEQYQKKANFIWNNSLKSNKNISSFKYRGIRLGNFITRNAKGPNQVQGALGEIDTFLSLKKEGFSADEINKLPSSKGMDFKAGANNLFESKTYRGVSDKSIIAKTLMFIGRSGKYKNNKTADVIPIGGIGGVGMSLFEPRKASSGFIPRFAAGDGSISLRDYMINKYGEVKDTSSLGGAALNAAYGKGVSLDELRSTSPKWANWSPGGATAAMRTGRAEAKKQTQINRANKYGYRKIILPWSKSVADFGGDPNEFGDAYENLVAQKFGAKRGDRFKRANDYPGIAGKTSQSKYNYTDVDFIVPKVAGDLSQGGSLIEARGGDKKNYNASDISKKFDNFFKNNPSYDSNKWNRILVSRNAAGYIPRAAFGFGPSEEEYYKSNLGSANQDTAQNIKNKQKAADEAKKRAREQAAAARKAALDKSLEAQRRKAEAARRLAERPGTAGEGAAARAANAKINQRINQEEARFRAEESARMAGENAGKKTAAQYTAEKAARQTSSYGSGAAINKSVERNQRKVAAQKAIEKRNASRRAQAAKASKGMGFGGGRSRMGGGMAGFMTSMMVSSLANSGALSEDTSMALNKGVEMYQKYQTFQMLRGMLPQGGMPVGGKAGKSAAGKAGKAVAGKAGKTVAGKAGKSAVGKVGTSLAKKFGTKALTKMGAGLVGGPIGEALAIASIATDAIGEGAMYFGSGGGNDERKARNEAEKEIAKFKTEGGKSLAGYRTERGAGMGIGAYGENTGESITHKFGAFGKFGGINLGAFGNSLLGQTEDLQRFGMEGRSSAVSGAIEGLGGIGGAKSIVDKFGGVGVKGEGTKGKLNNITEEVFNRLKAAGKETGGVEFNKQKFQELQTRNNQAEAGVSGVKALNDEEKKLLETYKTAKDVAAGLVKEVAGFDRANAAQKSFAAIARQIGEMQAKGTSMLSVYKQITASEEQRRKALADNLGGGVDAFLDPTKSADSMSKIQRSLRTLNDPRLAGNAVERGRAANAYMAGTTEMGIDIAPQVRGQLSRVQDQGLQTFQTQNFNTLNRMGAGFRNSYGLSQGINQGIYNAGEIARRKGMTIQEAQFTNDAGSVQGGYLSSMQGKALNLSPETVKGMEEASRKLQESIEKFAKVAEAYAGGKISEADFNRIQSSVEGAVKSGANSTAPNAQAEMVTAIEKAFGSLDAAAKAIVETKSAPASISLNGEIGLTKEAQEYLTLGKEFAKMKQEQGKKSDAPPSTMPQRVPVNQQRS